MTRKVRNVKSEECEMTRKVRNVKSEECEMTRKNKRKEKICMTRNANNVKNKRKEGKMYIKIKTFNEEFMTSEQKSEFRKTPIWNGECVNDHLGSNDYLIDLVYDDNDNLIAVYDHNWMNIITEETLYVRSLVEVPVLDWIPIDRNKDEVETEEEENYWN